MVNDKVCIICIGVEQTDTKMYVTITLFFKKQKSAVKCDIFSHTVIIFKEVLLYNKAEELP